MTTIIDGSAGITFPNGSNAQAAPSKVLQVVNATYATQSSTAGTSFVTTNLTASITPLFSTSKILILSTVNTFETSNSGYLTIYRGATNLGTGSASALGQNYIGSGGINTTIVMNYLDSPATTSSTTYTVYMANNAGGSTIYVHNNGIQGTITLMEIAQ